MDGLKVTIHQPEPPALFAWKTYDEAIAENWPDDCWVLMANFRRARQWRKEELGWRIARWNKKHDRYWTWTHFVRLPDELPFHEPRESC